MKRIAPGYRQRIALGLGVTLACTVAAPAQAAAPPSAIPDGLYGSVRESRETGDLGGLELRLFRERGVLLAEVVLCEGWCNVSHVVPVQATASGYSLRFTERYEGADGPAEIVTEVSLQREGKGLRARLSAPGDGAAAEPGEDLRLRALKEPFGLAVAQREGSVAAHD